MNSALPPELTDVALCLQLGCTERQLYTEFTPEFIDNARVLFNAQNVVRRDRSRGK